MLMQVVLMTVPLGLKKDHSTTLYAGIVKQSIDYRINRGSHVFVCFIDFPKAVDKVNYWKLLNSYWTMVLILVLLVC